MCEVCSSPCISPPSPRNINMYSVYVYKCCANVFGKSLFCVSSRVEAKRSGRVYAQDLEAALSASRNKAKLQSGTTPASDRCDSRRR